MTSKKSYRLALILVLLTLPAMAAEPVAEVDAAGSIMTWSPLTAGKADLRISGSGGLLIDRTLSAEAFSLNVVTAGLADGVYKWEITARGAKPKAALTAERRGLDTINVNVAAQHGVFTVSDGHIVDPNREERAAAAKNNLGTSGCLGFDCTANPNYGDTTLLLKENNTRIKFADTSNSPFPASDWEIEANSNLNGGQSYLAFNDCGTASNDGGCTTGRLVFAVEAGARANALYVESDGDIGIGTSSPVVEVHVTSGDSPTLRLEQDGSSGFAPGTWDVAANETNFFVRDVTNGSTLPFRIRPGAPTSSIDIAADGDVGIGISSPNDKLEIRGTDAANFGFRLSTPNDGWVVQLNQDTDATAPNGLAITKVGTGVREFQLTTGGDLEIAGDFVSNGTTLNVPDYVFADDYSLMPLDDLAAFIDANSHLPNIPSAGEINGSGRLNMSQMQMRLLEKVEELTLYTLAQEDTIRGQNETIQALTERLAALEAKLAE